MSDQADRFRDWDAAYVLGALSPDDRRQFERHFASCPECSRAVTELSGIPGLLGKLGAEEAMAVTDAGSADAVGRPEALLVQELAGLLNRRRTRVRAMTIAVGLAAAVAIGFGGIALGSIIGTGASTSVPVASDPPSTAIALTPTSAGTLSATLRLTEMPWGTRLDWSCGYGGADWAGEQSTDYALVVTDIAGHETVVATWTGYGASASELSAASNVAASSIRSVEIRTAGSNITLASAEL